jgi:hypothetical protein
MTSVRRKIGPAVICLGAVGITSDANRLSHHQDIAPSGQFDDPSFEQHVNEVEARSIRAWAFGRIELDETIVDLKSGECRHDVFDQFDSRFSIGDRCPALTGNDVSQCGGDWLCSAQVHALELNSRSCFSGKEAKRDIGSR